MISLSAALLIVTAPAVDEAKEAAWAKANLQASTAHHQCYMSQTARLPATVTPEAGAAIVFAACAPQREALAKLAQERRPVGDMTPEDVAAAAVNSENQMSERMFAAGIRLDRAMKANDQCIREHIAKLAATVSPEAGAATIFNACATQRVAALNARVAQLQTSTFTDEWHYAMIMQYKKAAKDKKEIATAKTGIADLIRKQRGGASVPAPAPAQ